MPPLPILPKKPPLANASPPASNQPTAGNRIVGALPTWHQMLVSAFVVGVSIWLIEQYASGQAALLLALLVLLGVAYWQKGFAAELAAIQKGV